MAMAFSVKSAQIDFAVQLSVYITAFFSCEDEASIYKQLFMHISESPALKVEWRV
jgi:hypothetical protein